MATLRFSASITENQAPARRACLAVVAATLLAYWPALRNGFVWNDPDYVTRPELRSLHGLERIWRQVGATEQYYPALHSAFWVEHRLWGDAPLGYHLANILLHAAAACLFGLVLRRLAVRGAWLGALLFALHPVAAESVAWVSEQKNTLSTVFYLLAALLYLRWRYDAGERGQAATASRTGGGGLTPYLLATICFVLAILSKSVAATLPAALLVVLWWKEGRLSWRRDVAPLLPWFAAAAAGGLFTAWVERRYIGAEGDDFALSFVQRTLIAGRAAWFYLGKLVWPVHLVFIYPRWTVDPGSPWQYVFPLGAVATLGALWLIRDQARGPLAGALLFVGSLFPVLGFFNVYAFVFSFVADHFQYLACLGLLALAAAGLAAALKPLPSWLSWAATAVLLGMLGTGTWRQCGRYHDLATFYQAIITDNPRAWLAHYNLGNLLREEGRNPEAIAQYQQALRYKADYPQAENNLGLALTETGQPGAALAHYQASIRLRPTYAQAHNNLATALRVLGRNAEAIPEYEEALRLKPDYAEAEYNLGLVLRATGRNPEAAAHFRSALRLQPDFPAALNDLANSLRDAGDAPAALAAYEQALRLRPDYPEALNNLGNTLVALGRSPEAVSRFEQALRLEPGSAVIHNDLGVALAGAGRVPEAVGEFAAAARLDPGNASYSQNLAIVRRMAHPASPP
jgi:tetratricopeptide (TPR) repeat protein